jgi:hypothetical protein
MYRYTATVCGHSNRCCYSLQGSSNGTLFSMSNLHNVSSPQLLRRANSVQREVAAVQEARIENQQRWLHKTSPLTLRSVHSDSSACTPECSKAIRAILKVDDARLAQRAFLLMRGSVPLEYHDEKELSQGQLLDLKNLFEKGILEKQLLFMFQLYDLDDDGQLSSDELFKMLKVSRFCMDT